MTDQTPDPTPSERENVPSDPVNGRPSSKAAHGNRYDTGPVVAVAYDGGRGAAWCNGVFAGDPEIIAAAERACTFEQTIDVIRVPILANRDTPIGATAALFAFHPGRTALVECPREVSDLLDEYHSGHAVEPDDDEPYLVVIPE